jgi:hypothetical protein
MAVRSSGNPDVAAHDRDPPEIDLPDSWKHAPANVIAIVVVTSAAGEKALFS